MPVPFTNVGVSVWPHRRSLQVTFRLPRGALDASTSQSRTSGKCSPYVPSGSSPGCRANRHPGTLRPTSWTSGIVMTEG